jgi:hypothetical protein
MPECICSSCDRELKVTDHATEPTIIKVEPCPRCSQLRYNQGYDDGKYDSQ